MAIDRLDLRNIEFRELFPWIHLFRGFRIALDPRKVLLGALGALVMSAGWWLIAALGAGSAPVAPEPPGAGAADHSEYERQQARYEWEMAQHQALAERLEQGARRFPWTAAAGAPDVFRGLLQPGGLTPQGLPAAFCMVLEPVRQLTFPASILFHSPFSSLTGLLLLIWTLLVWGVFGGAITRIAAVQTAREGHVSLPDALRFVRGRYLHLVGAPLVPFAAVVILAVLCALGGVLTWIPGVNVALGIVWVLALLAAILMALALLGLVVGWPLMYGGIGAEGAESIEAVTRAYSYIVGRPWHYLFYALVAIVYGGILTTFVATVLHAGIHLSQYAVSWGGGEERLQSLYAYAPSAGGWKEAFAAEQTPTGTDYLTALAVGFWLRAAFLAMVGFAYSYFWSASTVIYFLLRKQVDDTELEEVFLEEEEEEPFPTVAPSMAPPAEGPTPGTLPVIDPPPRG